MKTAVDGLRELSQGIHPAELTAGGLSPALKALGRRSAVRVELDVPFDDRLPDHVEVAAYYTVSEALTNASKHANATRVRVSLSIEDDVLLLSIRDDGVGGADPRRGSGLTGLRDRIEALGGRIQIESQTGSGTVIEVEIPIAGPADPKPRAGRAPGTGHDVWLLWLIAAPYCPAIQPIPGSRRPSVPVGRGEGGESGSSSSSLSGPAGAPRDSLLKLVHRNHAVALSRSPFRIGTTHPA